MKRLFFALWPPANLAQQLAGVAAQTQFTGKRILAPQMHLTLRFLGSLNCASTSALVQAVQQALRDVPPSGFTLQLTRLGYFTKPRILWLGPDQAPPALQTLAALVDTACATAGLAPRQSAFKPHVTLARRALPPQTNADTSPLTWNVKTFCLAQSTLDANGAHYQVLKQWRLREPAHPTP